MERLSSIAFIPDGNRRYAKQNHLSLLDSYRLGTKKAWDVLEWLQKYPSIKTGTFYTLSLENLTRNQNELKLLLKIFDRELVKAEKSSIFDENNISLRFIGQTHLLPKSLQAKMNSLEKQTENHSDKTINLAIGYSGQTEIVDAAKKICEQYSKGLVKLSELTVDSFKSFLYSDFASPDLIVRTSGTKRLSGFLTYQSAYSELYFLDKYWPELTQSDLDTAISDFEQRDRKFGK